MTIIVVSAIVGFILAICYCAFTQGPPKLKLSDEEKKESKLYKICFLYKDGTERKSTKSSHRKNVIGIKIKGPNSFILSVDFYRIRTAHPQDVKHPSYIELISFEELRVLKINSRKINPMLEDLGRLPLYDDLIYWALRDGQSYKCDIFGTPDSIEDKAHCIFKM